MNACNLQLLLTSFPTLQNLIPFSTQPKIIFYQGTMISLMILCIQHKNHWQVLFVYHIPSPHVRTGKSQSLHVPESTRPWIPWSCPCPTFTQCPVGISQKYMQSSLLMTKFQQNWMILKLTLCTVLNTKCQATDDMCINTKKGGRPSPLWIRFDHQPLFGVGTLDSGRSQVHLVP